MPTTLEWTTPINPGHGNWPGEIPEVHRWAYDYGKDGRDFIHADRASGPNENKALIVELCKYEKLFDRSNCKNKLDIDEVYNSDAAD